MAQWRAWWRILRAQVIAQHRESAVPPEPQLFGLDVMYVPDADFRSLAAAPELGQVVASSREALSAWLDRFHDLERPRGGDGGLASTEWDRSLIERADGLARRPLPMWLCTLASCPSVGHGTGF